jgi:hypothetical protein
MINIEMTRIFVGQASLCPKGYTLMQEDVNRLIGLKSRDIHIHLGSGWYEYITPERLQVALYNLAANVNPPLITVGDLDKTLKRLAMTRAIWM